MEFWLELGKSMLHTWLILRQFQFLWWKHGNLANEVEYYEISVHLFDGASSLSCSNYALNRTSIDHQKRFGEVATKSIQRNFYVDDMLKSSVDIETEINLIKRVRNLFEAGGFSLTKFVSNRMRVMQAISEESIRRNIKLKKLENTDSLNERALRLVWNMNTDITPQRRTNQRLKGVCYLSSVQFMILLDLWHLSWYTSEELFKFYVSSNWDGMSLFQMKWEKSRLGKNQSCQL